MPSRHPRPCAPRLWAEPVSSPLKAHALYRLSSSHMQSRLAVVAAFITVTLLAGWRPYRRGRPRRSRSCVFCLFCHHLYLIFSLDTETVMIF